MARQDVPANTMLDHFASGLARTGDVQRAAQCLGQNISWGHKRLAELCELLQIPMDPREDVDVDWEANL